MSEHTAFWWSLISSSQRVGVLVVVVQLVFLKHFVVEDCAWSGSLKELLWDEVVSVNVDALRDDGGLSIDVVVGSN